MENWRSAKKSCRASRNNITSRWPLWTAACAVWSKGWRTRHPVEWEHFKAENGLTGLKVTTGRLVYSLQQTVLRRGIIVREQR